MRHTTLARWTSVLLAFASASAFAQTIPVVDFARHSEISDVSLSPTGEYIALAVPTPDGAETQLQIVHLDGSGTTQTFRFGKQQHVSDLTWTADDQVTVARAKKEPLEDFPRSQGELMSTDVSGKRQETLFAYIDDDGTRRGRRKDEGWAYLRGVLDKEPGMALVSFTCWNCGEEPDAVIFKVDTRTGVRKEVERIKEPAGMLFDHDGIARYSYALDGQDRPKLSYRRTPTSAWETLPKALAGYEITSGAFAADNNTLYALASDKGEPNQLYKMDLAAGTRTKLLGRDDIEIDSIMLGGREGIPFAVAYTASKPSIQYLDPASEWSQLHSALMKRFPGQLVTFLDFTRNNSKLLFRTMGDRNPANFYVLDRANGNKITLVAESMPWLQPAQMAPTRPIEFKTRNGRTLFGFYTAKGNGPHPTIVMPHGGPFDVHDSWRFDPEVQFLASRGYGVLQVNYRGSSGRGQNFVQEAWRQWGGMIQDDITDGVRWAIDNKLADQNRICMFGASFGGYSALIQPVRNPEMYKCAIGYAGVYDLPLLRKTDGLKGYRRGRRMLDREIGTDEAVLVATSPALQASKVKVPVFLVHGREDGTAKFDQFQAMEDGLEATGTAPEVFVAPGEAHGFYKPENIAELYRRMEAFLDKHIGPNAK